MKKRLLAGIMAGVMAASVLVTGCGGSKDVKDGTFTPTKQSSGCVHPVPAADRIFLPVRSAI